MTAPLLISVAHGTRKRAANAVAVETTRLVAERLGVDAVTSYVELCDPLLSSVLADAVAAGRDVVVLPMLLSTGFHLRQDLPLAVSEAGGPAVLGRSLGPHSLLADAQVARLGEAGVERGRPLVMVAAGSSDELADRDLARAVQLLGKAWGAPVRLATLSGRGPRPADVVRPGDAVSPYLLAGGFFADRVSGLADSVPGVTVADVIGTHPAVVDLASRRTSVLLGLLGRAAA